MRPSPACFFSFAIVVAIVTVMVLSALERVADRSNVLDDERSRETMSGALKTFEMQLSATLNDYAAWDDAAANVYAADGMAWTISNYGEMSVNSSLFDMAIVIDDEKKPIMVYREGRPMDGALDDFFSPSLWRLFDKVKVAGPQDNPEATGFVGTKAGIAVVGVALVREKSGALDVSAGKHRYLIFARHLSADKVAELGATYVIDGLKLVAPNFQAPIRWRSRTRKRSLLASSSGCRGRPAISVMVKVRPMVVKALGLVGLFFVVLLIIGWLAAAALKSEEISAREEAHRDRLSGLSESRWARSLPSTPSLPKRRRRSRNVLILYLDLDGFKEVNDSLWPWYRRPADPRCCGRCWTCSFRRAPFSRASAVTNSRSPFSPKAEHAAALQLSEQILDFLAEPLEIGRRVVVIGASIGIAMSAARRDRPRRAGASGRSCHVQGQGSWPCAHDALRSGDGRRSRRAQCAGTRSADGDRRRRPARLPISR